MALTLTGTGGIFTVLGKYFHALNTLNIARKTTVYDEVQDAVDTYKLATSADLAFDIAVGSLQQSESTWRNSGNLLVSALGQSCQGFLVESVRADSKNNSLTLQDALEYLIAQIVAADSRVADSAINATVTGDGGNSATDVQIYATTIGRLGTKLVNQANESVLIEADDVSDLNALRFIGERAAPSKLSESWPAGSGIDVTIDPLTIDDNLLANGDFETYTIADKPDQWIIVGGDPGVAFRATRYEQQTVAISGTPTSGSYYLQYTDPTTSLVHATESLPYDANAAQVQLALRDLPGLSEVTVSSTGTSPNFTHTVTFSGRPGNIAQMTSAESFDVGSIVHATTVAGENGAIDNLALYLSDGTVALDIYQRVSLTPDTVYAFGMWIYNDGLSTTGFNVLLVGGIGGSTLQDSASGNQSIATGTLVNGWNHIGGFFRVAPGATDDIYLKLDFQTGSADPKIIDHCILTPAQELYPGGPYVGAFRGRITPSLGDKWTLDTTNDYAGQFQHKFNQVFPMDQLGLLLPTSGTTLISDGLIS